MNKKVGILIDILGWSSISACTLQIFHILLQIWFYNGSVNYIFYEYSKPILLIEIILIFYGLIFILNRMNKIWRSW